MGGVSACAPSGAVLTSCGRCSFTFRPIVSDTTRSALYVQDGIYIDTDGWERRDGTFVTTALKFARLPACVALGWAYGMGSLGSAPAQCRPAAGAAATQEAKSHRSELAPTSTSAYGGGIQHGASLTAPDYCSRLHPDGRATLEPVHATSLAARCNGVSIRRGSSRCVRLAGRHIEYSILSTRTATVCGLSADRRGDDSVRAAPIRDCRMVGR